MTYKTHGTCSRSIDFDVVGGKVYNVVFSGGCRGNSQGVSHLVEGLEIDEIIARLSGIQCRAGTSCPDQLAKALTEFKISNELASR